MEIREGIKDSVSKKTRKQKGLSQVYEKKEELEKKKSRRTQKKRESGLVKE